MSFSNYMIDDDVNFSPINLQSYHCSVHTAELDSEQIEEAQQLLREAQDASKGEAEDRLIDLSKAFLAQPAPKEGEHPCGEEYADRLRAVGKWPEN